ncbi:MAG: UDP-2,3-diacylglucosamine diphosphatase [Bacteroidales bacterium]|mgnify:CR=1 FL=1|nr:UDP-2,3-diacylglucosamine diphosphatase [Bacteroidales bacterium]MDD2686890.1 UDP-2,3-diacylglucosamine diphosphatase [Bacteroidales bacterium]MDD3329704.1 UDP-2,3-diacylglucosamine diphosphatase [Bacteroidales bacterium]MDD3690506.1 UDP-2,3-diacylglucosamine diphosphatase [Bacteroidales bacterium]MDD4044702.1 UDP-2,3-diacylglucosamine diphosphatase [Bacteroidales bacterium]
MESIKGNVYFISDCHFGLPNKTESDARERRVLTFLDSIKEEVTHLFLLGDIFDFWFEYKHVVPKDNIRFLGKLAELADKGIHIYYVLGNHDMWNFGYLAEEIGLKILRGNHSFLINNQKVYLGHGDALDPKDYGYHLIKWIYGRKINQHLFAALHPRWAFSIARAVSLKSRNAHLEEDRHFLGEDKEPIIAYCKNILQQEHYDFFLFGHRHFMLDFPLNEHSRYINVGDWQFHDSYVVMSNQGCELKQFK